MRITSLNFSLVYTCALLSISQLSAQETTRVRIADTGIEQKLIVTGQEAKLCKTPGDKAGTALSPFTILFHLQIDDTDTKGTKTQKVGNEDWIRAELLDEQVTEIGWIKQGLYTLWETRSMLDPLSPQGPNQDIVFTVFPTKDLKGKFDAQATAAGGTLYNVAPILHPADDKNNPVYNVVLNRMATLQTSSSGTTAKEITADDFSFELVYVIDTTSSMTPMLEGVKRIATDLSKRLGGTKNSEAKSSFRFGLVEYQDNTPGLVPAKVTVPLTSFVEFESKVAPLRVANIGSEEWTEDVIAGLKLAADSTSKRVGWSENSFKFILLVGDADAHLKSSPKSSTGMSIDEFKGSVETSNISEGKLGNLMKTFHFGAIQVIHSSGDGAEASRELGPLIKEQFEEIASINSQAGDKIFETVDAQSQESISKLVDKLAGVFQKAFEVVKGIHAGRAAGTAAASPQLANPIVKELWKFSAEFAATGNDKPATGYASERAPTGELVALEKWFVMEEEFKRTIETLEFLEKRFASLKGNPAKRQNSKELLEAIQTALLQQVLGQDAEKKTLGELLKGVPLRCPILELTIDGIKGMTNEQYEAMVLAPLKESIERGRSIVNDKDAWTILNRQKKNSPRFAMILVELMP